MRRDAFTLIELLVVVAIIALLIAILLPSLNQARDVARNVVCMSQQRQIGMATLMLTSDSKGQLPAVWDGTFAGDEPYQYSWIGREIFDQQPPFGPTWPSEKPGALLPYLSGAEASVQRLVRCPGLATGELGSGVGSNGSFDYVMIQALAGAFLSNIPSRIELRNLDSGETSSVISRLYTEEDPAYHINSLWTDPGHTTINRMGSWHPGNSGNYIAHDGSVHSIQAPSGHPGPRAEYFWGRTPSGLVIPISQVSYYGWWNDQ